MRKYKPTFGKEVDLDNPKTYLHLPKTIDELSDLMFKEIGYALCYMNYNPDRKMFFTPKRDGGQRKRVEKLIKYFAENRKNNYQNLMWYKEQVFLFKDEIENMC
jgi:hypothetical protein